MNASEGDVKKQIANTVKAVVRGYHYQTLGELRAVLSLYNIDVEETRGIARNREYHGLVYSATDDNGNRVGNHERSKDVSGVVCSYWLFSAFMESCFSQPAWLSYIPVHKF